MRFFTRLILVLVMTMVSASLAHATCSSDKALKDVQFKVHANGNFADLSKPVIARFMSSRDNFVYDTQGPILSKSAGHGHQVLKMVSFDDVTTPNSSKFGDVVFVFADATAQDPDLKKSISSPFGEPSDDNPLVEIRWWVDDVRHVAYNKNWLKCAVNAIPLAENSLF